MVDFLLCPVVSLTLCRKLEILRVEKSKAQRQREESSYNCQQISYKSNYFNTNDVSASLKLLFATPRCILRAIMEKDFSPLRV